MALYADTNIDQATTLDQLDLLTAGSFIARMILTKTYRGKKRE